MDNKYDIEIDPFDKVEEIIEIFSEHDPKIFTEEGKICEDIEEDAKYIVFLNPYSGNRLEIDICDCGAFSVFFAEHHSHFSASQGDYEDMIEMLKNIFSNNICAGVLADNNGKWFGGSWFDKSEIEKDVQEIFGFIFKIKEFYNKLTISGYTATYNFWNPIDNKVIKS